MSDAPAAQRWTLGVQRARERAVGRGGEWREESLCARMIRYVLLQRQKIIASVHVMPLAQKCCCMTRINCRRQMWET